MKYIMDRYENTVEVVGLFSKNKPETHINNTYV